MFGFLFYSPRCESSANFIRIITSEKINQMFNLINIDTMSRDQILNLGISKTPMLVLRDQNNQTIGVHEGQATFVWLNNLIQFRRQNMSKIIQENRKKLIQSNMAQNINKDLVGGKTDEMTGISDNYSYVDIDYTPSKNFLPYGQDSDFKILTFKDNQGKITNTDLNSKISEYNNMRSKTDTEIKTIIDTNLKSSLMSQIQNNNNTI
jgi:hypothetical protein